MSILTQPDDTEGKSNPLAALLGTHVEIPPKVKRAIALYMLSQSAVALGKRAHRWTRSRVAYTISVPSNDEVYDVLHQRVLDLIPEKRRRAVIVKAMRGDRVVNRNGSMLTSPDSSASVPKLRPGVFYDGSQEQAVSIGGHRIAVKIDKVEDGYSGEYGYRSRIDKILFTAHGAAARDAVMAFIADVTDGMNEPDAPRFYMPRWGNWNRRDDLVPRQLDTVFLRASRKEALLDDLSKFLEGRAQYEKLGIPWHRGYLFHGPPGTGKSSLARALATELGLDVYYLPISDLREDSDILQLVSAVPARAMLLLEDIDILHAMTTRDDETKGVTMSGVLNALDGVSTPAGLITVMTTNHREKLDAAIVRAGRVDWEEEIGFLDDVQLNALLERFFGGKLDWFPPPLGSREVAPGDIAEVLKRHMGDPDAQAKALCEALS